MTADLDDFDAHPGSATSLLRTVIGISLWAQGRWLPVAGLIALLGAVDVSVPRVRNTLSRVKAKNLLVSETRDRRAGYALTGEAIAAFERGNRRIMHPRTMYSQFDQWCLISFSVPETDRDVRHQLRRRLAWIGCGNVSPALWICPGFLTEEVEQIIENLDLAGRVTIFLTHEIRGATKPAQAIAHWWDLDELAALHQNFVDRHQSDIGAFQADPNPRTAFRIWTLALDTWRPIPYLDPGLPASLLPDDWPGLHSRQLFTDLRDAVLESAVGYARSVVDGTSGGGDRFNGSASAGGSA